MSHKMSSFFPTDARDVGVINWPEGMSPHYGDTMKEKYLLALVALACSVAFAQAPPGTVSRPSQETNPTASGGKPAEKAQMKVDAKKGADSSSATPMAAGATSAGGNMPMASSGGMAAGGMAMGGMGMNMKAMDTNGDGMISKKEWDSYHAMMWSKMKPKMKHGMMPMADMEAMMKGGPN